MVKIPDELARAIQSGDCVLWVGAGFGTLAGRPSWEQLLRRLVETCPEDPRESLGDLIEQGRLRTVLTYVHRHFGDEPLAKLLEEVSGEGEHAALVEGTEALAELPWRACFATTYADLALRIFAARKPELLGPQGAHHLSLRERGGPEAGTGMLVLRTPPTGRAMRADGVFYDLVEEVVRSRTILFLGFAPDDPDLAQIFDLLDRIGRGNRHFALLPWVSPPEAEELADRFAIEVIPAPADAALAGMFGELVRACAEVAVRPSDAEAKLTALDLGRAVRGVDLRADLALDEALSLDVEWIEHLVDELPAGSLTGLSASTLLRTGAVMLAHGRIDRARRCFQQVITQGAGRELTNFARFDLALTALQEGDRATALDGLVTCAENDRSLAVVPPRFQIREVLGRNGTSLLLLCRDRETKIDYDISVATLARPVGAHEHARFQAGAKLLAGIEHAAVRGVRGGFADGRLFGVMREPTPGFVLADTLDEQPMTLDKATSLLTPLMEGLAACHAASLLHRNLNPSNVVVGSSGAVLRGFGFPPVIAFARPSVRAANLGYMAPELIAGDEATTASDVYSIGALGYRLLTGRAPAGSLAPMNERNAGLDARVDELLRRALHPDAERRPSLGRLREELQQIHATPHSAAVPRPIVDRSSGGSAAVPVMIEETVSAPLGQKFLPPEDLDDLEAWAWILERKPTHAQAREAIARIEAEARSGTHWDRVAEAIKVRAQHSQVVRERIEIMGELASIYETKLAAPASAFEIVQNLLEELPIDEQLARLPELARLGALTGQWAQLAESMMLVADRTADATRQAQLYRELGEIFAGRLGASDRAVEAYENANESVPTAEGLLAVIPLYRKLARDAELAGALVTLADLQIGFDRHNTLCSAAKVLREQLGDEEGAMGAIEIVLAEDPDHGDALAAGESLARSLDRKPTLVDILARRGELAHGDDEAADALREASTLAEQLGDKPRALTLLQKLVRRKPSDRAATERLITTLRASSDPTHRSALVDALATHVDQLDTPVEQAKLLLETAALLDEELDGKERAADCRERVLQLLPIEHALARDAAGALAKWYRRQDDDTALAGLLRKQGAAVDADDASRADALAKLLELSERTGAGDAVLIEVLEQLAELQPGVVRWRDRLLERYLATDDFERAGPLIRAQLDAETDPKRKAELLLRGGILRQEIGKIEAAVDALEQAVELDPSLTDAWMQLRELYTQAEQPLKAIEAQVHAARSLGNRNEKVKLLFDAGKRYLDELDKLDRGLALLEEVVGLDPDHREATGILLERLVAAGDLARAWPQAQIYVMQVRSQLPTDHAMNLRALSLAGRCALAVDNKERARDYLEKARGLDATNLDVLQLLAELDMEAGRFADALRHYQSVVLGLGDKLGPAELSRLYVRMADARFGMDDRAKAVQMLERALDIDPDNEHAIERTIELSTGSSGASAQVKAKRKLAELLERRQQRSDDRSEQAALLARRIALLSDISRLQVDELKLLEDGVRTLEEVLGLAPDDPAVLHRILDLFTTGERWRDATNVLLRLAEAQTNTFIRAKYLFAGALIFRDHLDDAKSCTTWLQRTLELDPGFDKAQLAYIETLEKTGDDKELARAIRHRLKALPEGTPPARHLELFTQLGQVYEKLGEGKTALMAYHQASRLAAAAGEDDDHQRVRHEKAMKLAISLGDDELDKAIVHAHAIITATPLEFETYHRLVELYLRIGRKDRARALSRTLRFLKQADEAELELAEAGSTGSQSQARGTVSRELWRQALYHASLDPRLSDMFGILWPIVAIREGRTLAHHRVRRDARTEVSIQSPTALSRYLAYACQVLDAPVPDLYLRDEEVGGITIDALADTEGGTNKTVYPSVLAGREALAETNELALRFRAGRVIARAKPEHILAAVIPNSTNLRHAAWGAIAATGVASTVPTDVKTEAGKYAELFAKFVQGAKLDQLKALATKVVKPGDVDTRAWLQGIAFTSSRAGFVLCDSLDLAAQLLTREGDEGSPVSAKDRIRDLVAYSVSEPYLRLRKELGFGR